MRAARVCPAGRLSKAKQTELHARLQRVQERNDALLGRYDALLEFSAETRQRMDEMGRMFDLDDEDDEHISIADLAGHPR